jgi:cardiolipin synthase (CMP-forming)
MFFNLPTLLTWARIVAIPLIVGVFSLPMHGPTRNLIATVLFIVVALTDWADGYLARRLNQTSSFGAFLDPVADKFLVCASLLILVQLDRVGAICAFVIIGKLKTMVQMIAIPFLLFDGLLFGLIDTRIVGSVLIWIAAVLTIWSMVYYLQKALPEIRAKVS